MPLFQPSNITPSSFAGVGGGTIAVENPVNITWQVNGNVPMTAFKINFYLKEELIYTTDIIELAEPFYPTNNKGEPNFYVFTAFGKTWGELGFVNGNQYTMQIVQYWGNSTESGFYVEQFSQSAFITRTTPTLKIVGVSGEDLPAYISTVSKEVSAIFQQEQGDSVDWVRWKQYRIDNGEKILMYDTGVVNTAQLLFLMENLANSNSYVIECIVQTNNGVQVFKENQFYVSYDVPVIKGEYNVSKLDHASNLLEWSAYEETEDSILGVSNKTPVYENGKLIVSEEEIVTWNKINDSDLSIKPPYSIKAKTECLNSASFEQKNLSDKASTYIAVSKNGLVVSGEDIYKDDLYIGKLNFDNYEGRGEYNGEVYSGEFFEYSSLEFFAVCARFISGSEIFYKGVVFKVVGNNITYLRQLDDVYYSGSSDPSNVTVALWNSSPLISVSYAAFSFYAKPSLSSGFASDRYLSSGQAGLIRKTSSALPNKDYLYIGGRVKPAVYYPWTHTSNDGTKTLVWGLEFDPKEVQGLVEGEGCAAVYAFEEINNGNRYIDTRGVLNYIYKNKSGYIYEGAFQEVKADGQYIVQAEISQDGNYLIGITNKNFVYVYIYVENSDTYIYSNRFEIPDNSYVKLYADKRLYVASNGLVAFTPNITAKEVEFLILKTSNKNNISLSIKNGGYLLSEGNESIEILNKGVDNIFDAMLNFDKVSKDIINIGVSPTNLYIQVNSGEVKSIQKTNSQSAINEIQVKNPQLCNYIYVGNENSIDITIGKPTWGENGIFLTNFNLKTLQAGRVSVEELSVEIYRTDVSTKEMQKVYSASDNILALRDFGWLTDKTYTYSAYVKHGGKYTGTKNFSPTSIKSCQHYHLLMEAVQDEEQPDVYHVLRYWRFANNVESSAISNNNNPKFLETFTGYRLKQPSSRIGKNGVLSALISNASNGEYHDTKEQSDELFELSKSNNTFFVKDMKGNIYMAAISSAITQTINNRTITQETTISIPWEEIGSMDNISIIQTEADKNWKEIHRN